MPESLKPLADPLPSCATCQALTSRQAVEELTDEWRAATRTGPHSGPFFQPEWCLATLDAFFPAAQPNFIATRRESDRQLLGVLPLVRSRSIFKGMPLRSLRGPVSAHSCRADFVAGGETLPIAARAVWDALKADSWWQAIRFNDVLSEGAFRQIMRLAKEDGYPTANWRTRLSPTMPVTEPDPFITCPKRYKSFRNRMKGKLQRLSEIAPVTFKVETSPGEETMKAFYAMESSGWKGARGSAVASAPQTRQFYGSVWRSAAAHGYARVYSMHLGEKPIAMHFGLLRDGTYYTPKVTYDESYRDFSLGHLLMRHVIQDLASAGAVQFDFLGPNAIWKSVWTTSLQRHDNCFIFRPTITGRAAHAALTQVGMRLRAIRHRLYGDPQDLEGK